MKDPFRNRTWDERFQSMGDEAEAVFERVFAGRFERTGFNRPKNITMSALPTAVRYMPDYITDQAWYEVQGFGEDLTCKFKVEKLDALRVWAHDFPVRIFLWSSSESTWYDLPFEDVRALCWVHGERRMFPEGKEYYAFPSRLLGAGEPYVR